MVLLLLVLIGLVGLVAILRCICPEEEEQKADDIYSINREEAIRMKRSASQHSKDSRDAYLRGDHLSAKQHSQKAREEWKAAQELNDAAAKKILCINNCNNNVWKLDLHGLHAAEAVQALRLHLSKIESEVQFVSYKPSSTLLKVITGKGLHSRGQAVLPSAIENFLIEKGYNYDKSRPGMIAVQPKFRC